MRFAKYHSPHKCFKNIIKIYIL